MLATEGDVPADRMVVFAQQTRRKCEAGDAANCKKLGRLYLNGEGVPKDEKKALSIFEKTCDQGNMGACLDTGALYATATGTTMDMARAKELTDRACAGGEQTACENARAIAPYSP
jgi:TPR repeat protein